jgi:acyl-coenzyme A thioesterase PaaI-like protein
MSRPSVESSLVPLLERISRLAAGLECAGLTSERSHWRMSVPEWLVEPNGSVPAGGLGILVDAAMTSACVAAVGDRASVVTSHLHLELLAPLGTRTLMCVGPATAIGDGWALGAALVTAENGAAVARVSMGALLFDQAQNQGPPVTSLATGTNAGCLGMEIAQYGDPVTTHTPAHPWLANAYGGRHGGAGLLIGERTLHAAIGPTMRPISYALCTCARSRQTGTS